MSGVHMARAREAARLTQRQAAKELGISQGYLAGIEIGRNDPEVWQLLVKMGNTYGTSTDALLGINSGEKVKETNEILARLSPARYAEVMEIARLFLILDSQEYRTELIESLIVSSDLFGNGRVRELLLAIQNNQRHTANIVSDKTLTATDEGNLLAAIQ